MGYDRVGSRGDETQNSNGYYPCFSRNTDIDIELSTILLISTFVSIRRVLLLF